MESLEIVESLRTFISEELLDGREIDITPTTRLIELGLIDSLSVVVLLSFINTRYGVEVPLSELTEMNLQTIEAMSALLIQLGGGSHAA